MAKDPFAKDDGKVESNMKDEFADFGDPGKDSKGGGGRIKFIVAAFLVTGALATGGAYFLTMQNTAAEEPPMDVMKPPTRKMNEDAQMEAPKPPSDMPATTDIAPKPEVPVTPPPPPPPEVAPAPPPPLAPVAEAPKPHPEAKHTTSLPKVTKADEEDDEGEEGEEEGVSDGSQAPSLRSPEDGAIRTYDESMAAARFTWSGSGKSWINFSRNPRMSPVEVKAKTKANSYEVPRLLPGVWYWQVGNGGGKSAIRKFTVNPPTKRAIAFVEPMDGSALAKDNGNVAWRGDRKITYYRVEISNQGWANPNFRFATAGTQLQVKNVPQGPYQMRLGAFSEVSGRWEYTDPIKVNVQ